VVARDETSAKSFREIDISHEARVAIPWYLSSPRVDHNKIRFHFVIPIQAQQRRSYMYCIHPTTTRSTIHRRNTQSQAQRLQHRNREEEEERELKHTIQSAVFFVLFPGSTILRTSFACAPQHPTLHNRLHRARDSAAQLRPCLCPLFALPSPHQSRRRPRDQR
jgi:hypothetical protein